MEQEPRSGAGADVGVVVKTAAWLELAGEPPRMVSADLRYDAADCLAVTLVLRAPDGMEAPWTFAWELLADGLTAASGVGEVRARPVNGVAELVEVSFGPALGARVRLLARDVRNFVERVRERAADDAAHVGAALEAELALISGEPRP